MRILDLTGHRYGLLVVKHRAANASSGELKWRCRCDCGKEVVAVGSDLRRLRKVSCGCDDRQRVSTP